MVASLATRQRISRLQTEAHAIARRYGPTRIDTTDGAWLHVEEFKLPAGWNKAVVDVLIDIPTGTPGYPNIAPDWFWIDHDLRTVDGRPIGHFFNSGREDQKRYFNEGWGHFCIHVSDWRPAAGVNWHTGNSLLSYLDLIYAVFFDRQRLGG